MFGRSAVSDADADGVPDTADNCTLIANADRRDTNGDGYGNVVNFSDLGLLNPVLAPA